MEKKAYSNEAQTLVKVIHKTHTLKSLHDLFNNVKSQLSGQQISWNDFMYVTHVLEEHEKRLKAKGVTAQKDYKRVILAKTQTKISGVNPGAGAAIGVGVGAAAAGIGAAMLSKTELTANPKEVTDFKCQVCGEMHEKGIEKGGKKMCQECAEQVK